MRELKEAKSDMILGTCMAIFAVLFYAETYHFKLVTLRNTVDATFVPRVLSVIVLACSALLIWQGYCRYRRLSAAAVKDQNSQKGAAAWGRMIAVSLVLLAAAASFKTLGFVLTMPPMMLALFVILEKPERRRWGLYLLSSLLAPTAVFFIFYYGFSTLLPMGLLTPVLARFL